MNKPYFLISCIICIAGIITASMMLAIAKTEPHSRYAGVNVSLAIRNYCAWYQDGEDLFGSDCCIECKMQGKAFKYKISERTFESVCECREPRVLTDIEGNLTERNVSLNG